MSERILVNCLQITISPEQSPEVDLNVSSGLGISKTDEGLAFIDPSVDVAQRKIEWSLENSVFDSKTLPEGKVLRVSQVKGFSPIVRFGAVSKISVPESVILNPQTSFNRSKAMTHFRASHRGIALVGVLAVGNDAPIKIQPSDSHGIVTINQSLEDDQSLALFLAKNGAFVELGYGNERRYFANTYSGLVGRSEADLDEKLRRIQRNYLVVKMLRNRLGSPVVMNEIYGEADKELGFLVGNEKYLK